MIRYTFETKFSRMDQVKFVEDFAWSILEYFVPSINEISNTMIALAKMRTKRLTLKRF